MRGYDPSELVERWPPPVWPRLGARIDSRHHAGAAILFADIVGFTRLCERLSPEAAFLILRGFHDRMVQATEAHGAAVCDAIGDGILAVWTDPDGEENAARALRCGFDMLDAMARWSAERGSAPPLRIGVGLHAGPVMTGRTGGPMRPKLSAFGDAVNVANRLERLTRARGAELVVSEALYRGAAATLAHDPRLARFDAAEDVTVSGRTAPIRIRVAAG